MGRSRMGVVVIVAGGVLGGVGRFWALVPGCKRDAGIGIESDGDAPSSSANCATLDFGATLGSAQVTIMSAI